MAGIDLVDTRNNIVAQVSSTATRQKIESALSKDFSEANICLSSQSNLLELSENDKTQGTRISNQYGKETVNNNDRTDIMLDCFA